jgi:hypothetical protein
MAKSKETTKTMLKAGQKPQARKSSGRPKKGIHNQKRPASDGSDGAESSEDDPDEPCARPRKKRRVRRVNVGGSTDIEEVEEEGNEVDEQASNMDDASADAELVSSLLYSSRRLTHKIAGQ